MLQTLLVFILALIAVLLLIAFFMSKETVITSEITIDCSKDVVFDFLKHIKNQQKYSVWIMADPNLKIEYSGTDGAVGFVSSWVSEMKNVGVGAQEIMAIKNGEQIDVEVRFEKPFKGISQAITKVESIDASHTKYSNTFMSTTPFPMNLMSAMMKSMLQRDMDKTSMNLKNLLEKS